MYEVRTGYPYELGAEDPFARPPAVLPPCPLCSGKVDRDDPAARALDWGVRVAESEPGASDFWKMMTAAEMYRNADLGYGLEHSEARDIMDEFVAQGLDAATGSSDLLFVDEVPVGFDDGDIRFGDDDAGDAADGEDAGTPVVPADEQALIDEYYNIIKTPSGHDDSSRYGEGICCCEPFGYEGPYGPQFTTVTLDTGTEDVKKTVAGIEFGMEAVYSPNTPCACICCEFRQWIIFDTRFVWSAPEQLTPEQVAEGVPVPPPEEKPNRQGEGREDCFWMVWSPRRGKYGMMRSDTKPTLLPGTPPDKPVGGPYCPGNKKHAAEMAKKYGGGPSQTIAECRYKSYDSPKEGGTPPVWLRWRLLILGIVYDACRNWKPVRADKIDVEIEAYLDLPGTSWGKMRQY